MIYKKGFTLIELLLVVGIVTLLSSVLFYGTSEAKKKAEDAHMQAESNQVKTAITLYKNDTGRYPLTSRHIDSQPRRGMVHSESDPDSDYLATMQELVDGGYISEIPRSPDGQSYAYGVSQDGENAMFVATLKKSGPRNTSNSCEFVYSQPSEDVPAQEYYEGADCSWQPGSSGCSEPDENGLINCWYYPGEWVCMPEPQLCYTTPGTPGGCTMQPAVTETRCEDGGGCEEVVISEEVITCSPGTPPETICPGGGDSFLGTPPRLPEEVICGGGYESDYCQCI